MKITINLIWISLNRQMIYTWSVFHSYVSLLELSVSFIPPGFREIPSPRWWNPHRSGWIPVNLRFKSLSITIHVHEITIHFHWNPIKIPWIPASNSSEHPEKWPTCRSTQRQRGRCRVEPLSATRPEDDGFFGVTFLGSRCFCPLELLVVL